MVDFVTPHISNKDEIPLKSKDELREYILISTFEVFSCIYLSLNLKGPLTRV
jgi:hypothetical protein